MTSGTSPKSSDSSAEAAIHFRLRGVSRSFNGTAALHGVDLAIARGETVALVGPSGAGKTTLLRILNGSLRPSDGRAEVAATDISALPMRELRRIRARIGVVHQDLSLVPNLRVCQNVIAGKLGRRSFLASLKSMIHPGEADLERAHEILERVGIPEKLFERTDTLSGGQQQRVAIARALFQDPEAILADEPVSSVDPARAEDTMKLLVDVSKEQGLTLVTSMHNLDLARRHHSRMVGLRHGRILFDHPSEDADDECFRKLFELEREEMMRDGA